MGVASYEAACIDGAILAPVRKVELTYSFADKAERGVGIRNALISLLDAVREHGSISAAAKALGLSYRHVWGELKRWERELDQALVIWEKGQRARLSEFGEKLLWAERQAQARLAPQIEALHADLERAFAVAFDEAAHVLALFASHDDALAALREQAAAARLHLDIRFVGSVDAITALNQGRCVIAGFHVPPQRDEGSLAQRTYQPLLKPGQHKLVGFARRSQGLIVAPGNPLGLKGVPDIAAKRARFVNRAIGTGTRVLFDELLAETNTHHRTIPGYASDEPSHAAVALAVASGAADVGLGIEPAARARGLGFVPLLQEDYYLVCLKDALDEPSVKMLRNFLQGAEWQRRLRTLPGYEPLRSGEVLRLTDQLPWWKFKTSKS